MSIYVPDEQSKDASVPTSSREHGCGIIRRFKTFNPREVLTWHLAKSLAMGQGLAVLICGTAITSQYLATEFHVNTPMLQSVLNYSLMCATYTTMLLCRTGDGSLKDILQHRWWRYLLVGLVDVEANYTVVKAYQYTTLTSVQLLDCFVIPVLMLLSWFILRVRYRPAHYVGVCICLLGVGAMVGADLLAGRDQGSSSNILLGDGLVLLSASLYAVSNVCQEYTVKNLSRVEFLGMVGLFSTPISIVQMVIVERHEVAAIQWSWRVALLFGSFALCMFTLYSFMPIVVKRTSATAVNLSMLTADIFSLFCGLYLFNYSFSGLYLVSLVVIIIGFITFNAVPIPTRPTPDSASSPHSAIPDYTSYNGDAVTPSDKSQSSDQVGLKITAEEVDKKQQNGERKEVEDVETKGRRRPSGRSGDPEEQVWDMSTVLVERSTKL